MTAPEHPEMVRDRAAALRETLPTVATLAESVTALRDQAGDAFRAADTQADRDSACEVMLTCARLLRELRR